MTRRAWALVVVLSALLWLIGWLMLDAAYGATPSPYVPPATPTPWGRPPEIRCWQTLFRFDTSAPLVETPVIWCCYEWRANAIEPGRWAFLQCVR